MRRLYCCADQLFCVKYSSSCVRPVELHFTALVVHGLSNFGDQRSIDAVVTLGPALGVAVQRQLEQTGSTAKVVTYAFNNDLIPLLQNGKVAFTIDQQPYLQGYLSIDSLWLYHKNKSVIGAQQSVPTGPVVIDQSNIGNILDAVKAGLR